MTDFCSNTHVIHARCDHCKTLTVHYVEPLVEVYNGRTVLSGIDVRCKSCARAAHFVDVTAVNR